MRRSLPALSLALALLLSACASSAGPGWTFAPPSEAPTSQPAPSGDASAAPSPSAAPSAAPSNGGTGGEVVAVTALGIAFLEKEISAPADTPFVIRFDNQDVGVPHNVEIKDASGQSVFKGDIFNGAEIRDYPVKALPAGTYQFVCTVHPNMVGTLKVGG